MAAPAQPREAARTDRWRPAVRQITGGLLRGSGAERFVVVFAPHRAAEAALLAAYARAYGARCVVRAAGHAPPAAVERRVAADAAEPRTAVVVLSDAVLGLPPGVLRLAGTADRSPLDLWRPDAELDAAADALAAGLGRRIRVGSGGGAAELVCTTSGARRGSARGTAEAPLTGADGVFVADGTLLVNRATALGTDLAGHPVTVTVAGGGVRGVECADRTVARFIGRAADVHGVRTAAALCLPAGPAGAPGRGVTLRLAVGPGDAFNAASADLRIDLTAASGDWS
ncbi:hypothetical protein [Streptomyces sp. RFCAC02]|uniref:hypothetical protein n=1 Tax=Streptomyces sp. RFCAC02 TaxID=2499143 RepID=UPI00101F6BDF|nr:hypothetical protein [Streptomyces sp. RFCAC02]